MADKSLQVTISADVSSLQAKSAIAKSELGSLNAEVKNLANQFRAASDDMKRTLQAELENTVIKAAAAKAELAGLNKELSELSHAAPGGVFGSLAKGVTDLGEKAEAVTAKLMVFQGAFSKVAELAAVGFAADWVGEQINQVAELGETYSHLQQQTGATLMQLGGLKVAASETGTDFEKLGTGFRELGTKMQEAMQKPTSDAAQMFAALNVSITTVGTDGVARMRPVVDVFTDVSKALSGVADSSQKTVDAGILLGARYGSDLIPIMNMVGQHSDELNQKAMDLNVTMSQSGVEASERFKEAQGDLDSAMVGLRNTVVEDNLPGFTMLSQEFVIAAESGGVLSAAATALDGFLKVVITTVDAGVVVFTEIADAGTFLGDVLGDVATDAAALALALSGDFKDAEKLVVTSTENIGSSWSDMIAKMKEQGQDFAVAEQSMFHPSGAVPDAPKPNLRPAPQLAPDVKSSGPDVLAQDQTTLAQQNAQIEATATSTKQANEEKLQNTVQYWEGVLAAGNLSSKQELQVQTDLAKAETALKSQQLSGASSVAKSAESEQTQIAKDAAEARKQISQSEYETKVQLWDSEVTSGKMSKAQEVQDEIAAQQQMYAAALDEAQKEAALDKSGTAAKAKALDDIAVMQAQHVELMAQLNNQLVTAQTEAANKAAEVQQAAAEKTTQAWQKAFSPINQAFDSSINGVIQGTQTLQNAEAKAAQSIALAFIDAEAKKVLAFAEGEAQIALTALASQAKISTAVQAGQAVQTATHAAGAAEGKAVDTATASTSILGSAAKAAAGAFSAVAGIPYVGPVLAPAAGAAAYAAVIAYDVLSASGGLQTGPGEEPLVQLHENETVLPAHISDPMRAFFAQGNTSNNSTGDTNVTNHFNLSASGGSRGSSADDILSAVNDAVRSGSLQNYPAIARMMRR
jgi:hypothetical protein